jgi:hypothetical protein
MPPIDRKEGICQVRIYHIQKTPRNVLQVQNISHRKIHFNWPNMHTRLFLCTFIYHVYNKFNQIHDYSYFLVIQCSHLRATWKLFGHLGGRSRRFSCYRGPCRSVLVELTWQTSVCTYYSFSIISPIKSFNSCQESYLCIVCHLASLVL